MKIVFMGTPDFAVPCLEKIINDHEVAAVFTQPDKPVGRKHILTPPPVKVCALKHNIPVYQPVSVKSGDDGEMSYNLLTKIQPDVCVVVAYGKILPKSILDIPKYGCINIHASLLPKYRGASPVQWAIVCGETKTGVSSMLIDEGMDTGDILLKKECEIKNDSTAEDMFDILSALGADILLDTLSGLENGSITPKKQDETAASYAPIIKKEDALIDFTKSAEKINDMIRGLHIWPVAYTYVDEKRLKIFKASVITAKDGKPGEILSQDKEIVIKCGGNTALSVSDLQLEGSKRMDSKVFLNGRKLEIKSFI